MSAGCDGRGVPWAGNLPPADARYRVGGSVGRTVYVQVGDAAAKTDVLVGLMDTRELAALVVDALNAFRDRGMADPAAPDIADDWTDLP